jgi:hypothetical protein
MGMRGLMLKDFYVIRDAFFIPMLMMVVIGAVLSIIASPWTLIVVVGLFFGITGVTTIQSDKSAQWDKFSATLPVSRARIVSSKYCMCALLSLLGIFAAAILCGVVSTINAGFDMYEISTNICLALIFGLLPASVNIPCSFCFDAEKGVVGIMLSYLVTSGAFAGLLLLLSRFMDVKENALTVYGIIAAFSVAAFSLSWIVGPRVLSRKEL